MANKEFELDEQELSRVSGGHYYFKGSIVYSSLFEDCPGQSNNGCFFCVHKKECEDFSLLDVPGGGWVEQEYDQTKKV